MSDITKVLSNGIVLADNMSFVPRTVAITDATRIRVTHSLGRNPIVLLAGGRILCYKVFGRTSNYVEMWFKLPEAEVVPERGKFNTIQCRDTGWFIAGDVIKVGEVVTVVDSARDGIIATRDPVVLTGVTKVSLYQESVDLLLF